MVEVRFLQDCYFLDTNKMYGYNDIVKIDKQRAEKLQKRGIIDTLKDSKYVKVKEKVEEKIEIVEEKEEKLSKKSVSELKEIAKGLEIEGYNSLNKKSLIEQIEQVI